MFNEWTSTNPLSYEKGNFQFVSFDALHNLKS